MKGLVGGPLLVGPWEAWGPGPLTIPPLNPALHHGIYAVPVSIRLFIMHTASNT